MVILRQFGRTPVTKISLAICMILGCCNPGVMLALDEPSPQHDDTEAMNTAGSADAAHDPGSPAEPVAKRRTVFQRMTPRQQLRVIFGLATILLLGLVMILVAWLGARSVRRSIRMADRKRSGATGRDVDDWARKPLVPREDRREGSS
jgi:hypothetical protein